MNNIYDTYIELDFNINCLKMPGSRRKPKRFLIDNIKYKYNAFILKRKLKKEINNGYKELIFGMNHVYMHNDQLNKLYYTYILQMMGIIVSFNKYSEDIDCRKILNKLIPKSYRKKSENYKDGKLGKVKIKAISVRDKMGVDISEYFDHYNPHDNMYNTHYLGLSCNNISTFKLYEGNDAFAKIEPIEIQRRYMSTKDNNLSSTIRFSISYLDETDFMSSANSYKTDVLDVLKATVETLISKL